ncbi:MAG TPA: hypothetical protein VGO57_14800 [Verrucomicrobiae bacterium]
MGLFGGGANDGGAAAQEAQRQANITSGMDDINRNFAQFDDGFYDQAAKNYTAANTPQLLSDFQNTKKNLTYSLARSGLINSSAANQLNSSLGKTLASNESSIANNAQNSANQLRANVSDQKSQLVSQLESSADPLATSSQTQAAVSQLSAPAPIQPIGNMFADWTNTYLNKQPSAASGQSIWSTLTGSGSSGASGGGGTNSTYFVQ